MILKILVWSVGTPILMVLVGVAWLLVLCWVIHLAASSLSG
ncbi:hypothetical protein [Ferrovum sp.]|jgi:hypothetical protein|nr:hypothetical protein [Ferrovum sp.]